MKFKIGDEVYSTSLHIYGRITNSFCYREDSDVAYEVTTRGQARYILFETNLVKSDKKLDPYFNERSLV